MGQLRTVACTSCGAERTTKANRGVALVCTGCGGKFPAPAPDPAPELEQRTQELEQPTNGVRVTRGTPKIVQRARPRARAQELEQQELERQQLEQQQLEQRQPELERTELQRAAGRRGGLASYARWRLTSG